MKIKKHATFLSVWFTLTFLAGGSHVDGQIAEVPLTETERAIKAVFPSLAKEESTEPTHFALLKFSEFKREWNLLSDTIQTNMYVEKVEVQTDAAQKTYNCAFHLTPDMDGHFLLKGDGYYIGIKGAPSSIEERHQMLRAWSQLIYITNPSLEPYDVEEVLNKLHAGSEGDLSPGYVQRNSIRYYVSKNDGVYELTVHGSMDEKEEGKSSLRRGL